jgi:hypothetical protein
MKRILILLSLILSIVQSTEFSGNQNKVYVTQGEIEINGYGITQLVRGGEITFYGENLAPTSPKKYLDIEIQDIAIELEAPETLSNTKSEHNTYIKPITTPERNFIIMGVNG